MRVDDDIKNVTFTLVGRFQIDKERVEADPHWARFQARVDMGELQEQDALKQYLGQYIVQESFPTDCPVTNGPADFLRLELEVVNARGH